MSTPARLRILQLTEAFEGGVFASVTRLSTGLAARGHDVHLAYARREGTPADVGAHVSSSVQLHELALVRAIAPRADLAGLRQVRRLLLQVMPDVVHLHSSKAGVLGRVAAYLSGYSDRTFYSPRGLPFLQEDRSAAARFAYEKVEWAMARPGGTVVACSASELALVRARIRPRRAVLVENGVDIAAVPPWRDRGDGRIRVAAIGRLTYARNAALFAQIARGTARSDTDFVWIGGGDAGDHTLLREAGVSVSGWLPRAAVLDALRSTDIFVHASRWEGMPIALIEAQVSGVPSVATDVVGNRDVIRHGVTGYLGGNRDEMLAHVGALIDDARLRREIGGRARSEALTRFSAERVVDDLEQLYAGAAL